MQASLNTVQQPNTAQQPMRPQWQQVENKKCGVIINPNKQYLPQQVPSLTQSDRGKKPFNEFKLKKKIEQLMQYLYPEIIRHMKRLDRCIFGEKILLLCSEIYTHASDAEFNKRLRRKIYEEIDCKQKSARNTLYLAQLVKAIPVKKYEVASRLFCEIGSIVGALLKTC